MQRKLILGAFCFVASTSTFAAEEAVNCKNPKYTPEFNFCSEQAFKVSDKKLNESYAKARIILSDEDKRSLLALQREWVKMRDAHCDLETKETKSGTAWYQFIMECKTRMTINRTVDLESLLKFR